MKKLLLPVLVGLGVLMGSAQANAAITFYFNDIVAGTPEGGPTWAVLTITDAGGGFVNFSFENTTDGSEAPTSRIAKLLLNVDPFVSGLTLTESEAEITGFSFDEDSENDSGSSFDLAIDFDPSDPDVFAPGETVTWQIYGDGLTEESFNVLSGGNSQRLAMIHLLSVDDNQNSAKVQPGEPVPEPASLIALGLGGLALLRRRKK